MKLAVLIASHGTPSSPEEVPAFFKSILGGKEPKEDALKELLRRYELIKNYGLLNKITERQFELISQRLKPLYPEVEITLGYKHVTPTIDASLEELKKNNPDVIIVLALSPYYISPGTKNYLKNPPKNTIQIEGFHQDDAFRQTIIVRLKHLLKNFSLDQLKKTAIIFSAHSIPTSSPDIQGYKQARSELVNYIVLKLELEIAHFCAYQSIGFSGGSWLGPSLVEVIDSIKDIENVVVVTDGFITTNSEILYDLDIEFKNFLTKLGKNYWRVPCQDDATDLADSLSEILISKINSLIKQYELKRL